jgi:hypothetical protein
MLAVQSNKYISGPQIGGKTLQQTDRLHHNWTMTVADGIKSRSLKKPK